MKEEIYERSLRYHEMHQGKIALKSKVRIAMKGADISPEEVT